jgi:dTMP kinase
MTRDAKFITIEGIEGVGKSTQCALLVDALRHAWSTQVLGTREPGGTQLGEMVRSILLDPALPAMDATAELLLMFAARAEHLNRVILPALETGTTVISDRFTDATYAYQGGGRVLDAGLIASLETLVQRSFRPHLTVFLDLEVELALKRTAKRGGLDRFEIEQHEFFDRVRHAYLARARAHPERIVVVDASADIDTVHHSVMTCVTRRFE